jgi:predicted double-glycine peptidase
MRHTSHQEFGC